MTWLEEFRCDGLRFDATVYIRTVDGDPATRRRRCRTAGRSWPGSTTRSGPASPGRSRSPRTSQDDPSLVTPTDEGGAGFGAQWDAGFIYRVRPALVVADDADRDMDAVVAGDRRRGPRRSR